MEIRRASEDDLERIMEIYGMARQTMRKAGNDKQWINGYPSRELVSSDIQKGNLYVMMEKSGIHAVFALIPGEDPTYREIDGEWLNQEPYYCIHRIGSDGTIKGSVRKATEFAFHFTSNIRIDTHRDNQIMQHVLQKLGYQYCGVIVIEDGSERIAFQLEKGRLA